MSRPKIRFGSELVDPPEVSHAPSPSASFGDPVTLSYPAVPVVSLSPTDRALLGRIQGGLAGGGYVGGGLTIEQHRALLADILELEPQLKHYQTNGRWDVARVHRAAEHLRGIEALESVGYTDHPIEPDCD